MAQVTDYRNDIRPNWCPGCGHYGVQAAITDAVTQLDIAPERLAVISGPPGPNCMKICPFCPFAVLQRSARSEKTSTGRRPLFTCRQICARQNEFFTVRIIYGAVQYLTRCASSLAPSRQNLTCPLTDPLNLRLKSRSR